MQQMDISQFLPEDSHVSLSVSQEIVKEVLTNDGSGVISQESSEKLSRLGLLSRIVLDYISFQNGNRYNLTWKRKVINSDVTLFLLPLSRAA